MSDPLVIRPVETADHDAWSELFNRYRDFYGDGREPALVERVWGWLLDDDHEVDGLVAETAGEVIAIAHYRRFARPSSGTTGLWLDDLYVSPDVRSRGIASELIKELQSVADREGLSVVRWITAQDNDRARSVYDRLASATRWVTYDAEPHS